MQITIPGVNDNSGIDTNKLIEDLMQAERIPLERVQESITASEQEITIWRRLHSSMRQLEDQAKKMYSFNNPFNDRSIESSHPSLLQAQTTRGSTLGDYTLYLKQTATPDKWISKKIPEDYKIPKGKYIFEVGEEEIEFDF